MLVVTKFNKNIDAVLPIVLLSSKCPLERYTHVSLLIEMGFSALAIAERMGHKSIKITYQYAHLFPTKQTQMAEMLDKVNSMEGDLN